MSTITAAAPPVNSPRRVLLASLIGTTIEFFDFYIYATAAVLVFPHLFFPDSSEQAALLQSLATFAVAFIARPVGSAVFGHFGDRIGRKATLVAALLTMGLSTVLIGLLPTHAQIGLWAPALLALCRFGQGLGLGGKVFSVQSLFGPAIQPCLLKNECHESAGATDVEMVAVLIAA